MFYKFYLRIEYLYS